MDGVGEAPDGGRAARRAGDRRRRALGPRPVGVDAPAGVLPRAPPPSRCARASALCARRARTGPAAWWSAWPRSARRSTIADVRARASGAIGRPHVADALVAAGHARDRQDAFDRFLGDGGPGYVAHEGLGPREAIALVAASGGASALAHPASLRMPERELGDYVQRLAAWGIARHRGPPARPHARAPRAPRPPRGAPPIWSRRADPTSTTWRTPCAPATPGRPPLPHDAIDHLLFDTVEP